MISKTDTIKYVAPVFVAGAALIALTIPALEKGGHLEFEPNPGALAKSPYGRTAGLALQGPVSRFWDRGIGSIEGVQRVKDSNRLSEKLFKHVVNLREEKTSGQYPPELKEVYQGFTMAKIERKLEVAWSMDPRNFGNYAVYQIFLWEGFAHRVIDPKMPVREMSLETLNLALKDERSPLSLLTAGQAAYDLVFAARTSTEQDPAESRADIMTYSKVLPDILAEYDQTVADMKADGSWNNLSEIKHAEFAERKRYLDYLNQETEMVVKQLTQSDKENKEDRQS